MGRRLRFLAACLVAGGIGAPVLLAAGAAGAAACGTATAAGTACALTGTATLGAGSLTLAAPGSLNWSATLSGLDQHLVDPADTTYTVDDATGSGAGWHVAVSATQFTAGGRTLANAGTVVNTGSTGSVTATTAPAASCHAGATCTLPADSTTYPVAIATAATSPGSYTIYDTAASTGLGEITIGGGANLVGWWVNVPASSSAGAYTSTFTLEIVSAP